ncbi:MAG: acetyltransferase [Deltaproteobacteria bacterium]|nr:acetyltransferase [Deltaproteobacteria bacterium]
MKKRRVAIYGAGGFGREVAWLAESYARPKGGFEVVAFIDDEFRKPGETINGFPVVRVKDLSSRYPDTGVAIAIGNPKARQAVAERCLALGLAFVELIHEGAETSRWVEIGEGAVICGGNIITTNIIFGTQVQINLDCTIGHDVIMDDYTTLAPGVHVSGCVHMGKRVYVGTGAVFVNGTQDSPLVIGDDAVIGAGACVTKSVPSGETWVGIPARPLVRP